MTKIKRCKVDVVGGSWVPRPCNDIASAERDGKYYCKKHDPVRIEKRNGKAHERLMKKRLAEDEIRSADILTNRRADMFPVLVYYLNQIAAVIEPPIEKYDALELAEIVKQALEKIKEAGL